MEPTNTTSSLLILPTVERTALNPHWSKEQNDFRNWLDTRLAGQEEPKDEMTEVLGKIRSPLRDPNLPVASFILAGPSRVGKTELFKLLVEWVNGDAKHMMMFSGSEFMEKHLVQKMIGAPHGYIGFVDTKDPRYTAPKPGEHDTTAELSQHNIDNSLIGAKSNFAFVLFDEWEKFHEAFNPFLLQPLGEGRLTLNNGSPVNFRNVVIGFTSNIGARDLEKVIKGFGFNAGSQSAADETVAGVSDIVIPEIVKFVPQEFRNRIERIIVFRALRKGETLTLVDVQLEKVRRRILNNLKPEEQFLFDLTDDAKRFILAKSDPVEGKDTKNRVPKLMDTIEKYVVMPLGQLLQQVEFDRTSETGTADKPKNTRMIKTGDRITISYREGDTKLTFERMGFDLGDLSAVLKLDEKGKDGDKVETSTSKDGTAGDTAGTAKTTKKAARKTGSSSSKRRTKTVIFQTFHIEGEYGENVLDARQYILADISELGDRCVLMAESTDHMHGTFSCVVKAPVEAMMEMKADLAKAKWHTRIYGGVV